MLILVECACIIISEGGISYAKVTYHTPHKQNEQNVLQYAFVGTFSFFVITLRARHQSLQRLQRRRVGSDLQISSPARRDHPAPCLARRRFAHSGHQRKTASKKFISFCQKNNLTSCECHLFDYNMIKLICQVLNVKLENFHVQKQKLKRKKQYMR